MKPKIVLINPRTASNLYGETVPLALLSIASMPDQENKYNFEIINVDQFPDEKYKKELLKLTEGALCFGISSMTGYQIKEGLEFAKLIKDNYPNIPIIWGGFHCSILPQQSIKNQYVDIIVRGQGQRTFYELVKALENKSDLRKVKGILFKENEKVIETPDRLFENINNFPSLPYHLFKTKEYVDRAEKRENKRNISYISSQGCPYRCVFCAEKLVSKRRWMGLTAERMLQDMENLVREYNVNCITINDNNFFVDKERIIDLCKGLIKKKIKVKLEGLNGRAENLVNYTKKEWEILKQGGVNEILIGAESGSQEILKMLQKDATVEDTIKLAKLCKEYKINLTTSLMVGLPPRSNETAEEDIKNDFSQTMRLIDSLNKIRNENNILLFLYTPYPGNELFDKSMEMGLKPPQSLEEWSKFELSLKTVPWISNSFYNRILFLRNFIFPYMSDLYEERHVKKFKLMQKVFHDISLFRWDRQFFSIPIEYSMFRLYKNIRDKKDKIKLSQTNYNFIK